MVSQILVKSKPTKIYHKYCPRQKFDRGIVQNLQVNKAYDITVSSYMCINMTKVLYNIYMSKKYIHDIIQ